MRLKELRVIYLLSRTLYVVPLLKYYFKAHIEFERKKYLYSFLKH